MPPPTKIEQAARHHWDERGGLPPPPRQLERPPFRPSDCAILKLHPVTPHRLWQRMREQKILLPTEAGEGDHRPLLGAILAYRGKAIITVDSTLPDPLRRFVVAHEIAHFLLDYRIPRQRVVNRLGPSIIPVLDGLRTVQLEDELAALLAGVRLGLYAHYLKRDEEWQKSGKAIETQADALAFELLAPWAEVYARLAFLPDPQQAEAVLQHEYGFPADHANYYARQLQDHARKNPSPSAQWGL